MVRLAILYPNAPGARFDMKYYVERHMAGAHQMLAAYGLRRVEVDRAVGTVGGGPAPYACIGYFYFESADALQRGLEAHGATLAADVPNYTDIAPQLQIGEVMEIEPVSARA